jgi:Protein kinase domain/Domain of unknown function (DUF4352)
MEASADRRLVADRYVLGGPLGRGGMGTVWRAEDVLLGRPVAVKEVELPAGPPGAEREALRRRALREARAAARLNHPGVVTVHDAVEADDRLFLVMELVEAPTLGDLVDRSGPVEPATAARFGLELLDALEAAHRAGIVHHDVKPANVMVVPGGRVKLADFGIASLQEDTHQAVTAAYGSLPYVAPEQASGRAAGAAADLWALGATLWFAVEGVPPFWRPGPAATLTAILHDPPGRPRRAGLLEPVLTALLVKDPGHRPPPAAVRQLLEAAAAGVPGPPPVTSVLPERHRPDRRLVLPGWTAPPPRRRRWGRRLLVAAALLLLLALASNLGNDRAGGRRRPGLGDPVRDGQFEFVVRSVACGKGSGGEGITHKPALEQFCLLRLEVENTGREGRTFGAGQQFLFDDAGNRHDPDLDATVRHGGHGRLLSTHLNPGQRLEGTLVYDVPDGIVLDRAELHDGPFSGGVSVELG